jgi:lauroyl/myristoyl acyltransferase
MHVLSQKHHDFLFQGQTIVTSNDMRNIIQILKDKKNIILLQDNWTPKADPIYFLGVPFRTPLGSLRLAKLTNATILPFLVTHTSIFPQKWTLRFWPPIDPEHKNPKERLVSSMEEMIRSHPECWELWNLLESCKIYFK